MTNKEIIDKINSYRNGALIKISVKTDLNKYLKSCYRDSINISKVSCYYWRKGIEYKNQKVIKEQVENGERTLTHQLPKGFGLYKIIKGTKILYRLSTNQLAIQVFDLPNNKTIPTHKFFINGNDSDFEEVSEYLIPSYFNRLKDNKLPLARTVYLDNIIDIK